MSTREVLLAAVYASPDDDLARLVFADYLEESDGGDHDAATAEFIRLSCRPATAPAGKRRPIMPRAVYPWLDANWLRLVPSAVALHVPEDGEAKPAWGRAGREVRAYFRVRPAAGDPRLYAVVLAFDRGFVDRVDFSSRISRTILEPALLADQPFLVVRGPRPDG